MKPVYIIILIISFYSCKERDKLITTEEKSYIFSAPQDSIAFSIIAPDSIRPVQFLIKYSAHWNDTIIDRGVKLSAREYNTSATVEYYGGPVKFSYKKYKATDYHVKISIAFIGYKKEKRGK